MTNTCVMLVGLPMSGKSTFWNQAEVLRFEEGERKNFVRISTDECIERVAGVLRTTYSDVFSSVISFAEKAMYEDLHFAINRTKFNKFDTLIVWDQTNLTRKSRAKKLAKIPSDWKKIAVYFPLPEGDVLEERKEQRAKGGKTIPENIFSNMDLSLQFPSYDEGFDEVYWFENNDLRKIEK